MPSPEFWREEELADRREMRRQFLRWGLLFGALLAFVFFAFWWSGRTVHFGASRVEMSTHATWRVRGTVRDARGGAPVAWAELQDDPAGRPPLHSAIANLHGAFELNTIAEPHDVLVSAFGYRPKKVRVGRNWYLWMPRGSEQLEIQLEPENPPL